MARKSRDFEPFVKPNSAPALALKARNTSGGTITWIGLFFFECRRIRHHRFSFGAVTDTKRSIIA